MNDKIYEFATRAGLITFESIHDSMAVTPSIESVAKARKFAEMIVRECLSIVKSNTYGPCGEYDYSYSDENSAADDRAETIYEEIAYRFGVEE